jgi:predicted nucleic acid-binding protein
LALLLLDSTVLIDYLRGRPAADRVDARAEAGDLLCTTAINVEEIVRGLRPAEQAAAEQLFGGLRVFPIRAQEAWRAGAWRRDFAAKGVTLAQADCLIGAAAFERGATLATGNPRDFPMGGVVVEHWPTGA